jgi:uncharacterized membrane protein
MDVPKLKTRLVADAVRYSSVAYDAAAGGWTVVTPYGASGREKTERLTRQRGGVRVFATLEAAAARCLASLGISEFPVAAREWHALASA